MDIIAEVKAVTLPYGDVQDQVVWELEKYGKFSLNSAIDLHRETQSHHLGLMLYGFKVIFQSMPSLLGKYSITDEKQDLILLIKGLKCEKSCIFCDYPFFFSGNQNDFITRKNKYRKRSRKRDYKD